MRAILDLVDTLVHPFHTFVEIGFIESVQVGKVDFEPPEPSFA
jgi:hypothetical protein